MIRTLLIALLPAALAFSVDLCPVPECTCDVYQVTLDCSANQWTNVSPIVISGLTGDDTSKTFFSVVEVLNLERNDIRTLPNPDVMRHLLPRLSEIQLNSNSRLNCSDVEVYEGSQIKVISDRCPNGEPRQLDPAGSLRVGIVELLERYLTQQKFGRTEEAVPGSKETSGILTTAKDTTNSIAWSVIFLNCCFVGISGMVIGSILTAVLPLFVRAAVRLRKQNPKKEPPLFHTDTRPFPHPFQQVPPYKPREFGSAKRINPMQV